ncbi:hypothetical protein TYRP_020661 [Tyrophagus putrescentiae]|nr:hypothetical protein TYRP_020661 [Tyrophagus putrescentiae]
MTNDSNIQCTCFLAVLCCAIPVLSLLSSTSVPPNPWTAANVTKLAGLLLAVPGNGFWLKPKTKCKKGTTIRPRSTTNNDNRRSRNNLSAVRGAGDA